VREDARATDRGSRRWRAQGGGSAWLGVVELHGAMPLNRDCVGAKMDSMDLEREKGITIQSAATYCTWKDYKINIIDTPSHVDFTIEVKRALRVLNGAILVLCSVGGVDRQMRRYDVPRLAFINKLHRMGADPWKVLNQARSKLRHYSVAMQVPIGLEEDFKGLVDLVQLKAYYFHSSSGEKVVAEDVPADMEALVAEKRRELIETVLEVDDKLAEAFLGDETISAADLEEAVRRSTVAHKFIPVFTGSAFKNKGVLGCSTALAGVGGYTSWVRKHCSPVAANHEREECVLPRSKQICYTSGSTFFLFTFSFFISINIDFL